MKTYIVKAAFKGRTIEFDIHSHGLTSALRDGEVGARDTFRDAGISCDDGVWYKDSKISVKEKKMIGAVAQMAERLTHNQRVVGSSPASPTICPHNLVVKYLAFNQRMLVRFQLGALKGM